MDTKKIHEGRNVKRFRELFGMKQEALADALGDDWTQKKISLLEAKESIELEILEEVAKVLKVPTDALRNFDAEQAISNINTFYDNSAFNFQCAINPVEKWMQAIEEIKRLYERLLQAEKEKTELLQKVLDKMK